MKCDVLADSAGDFGQEVGKCLLSGSLGPDGTDRCCGRHRGVHIYIHI